MEEDCIYCIVEWINGNPVLDGMPCNKNKEIAINKMADLAKSSLACMHLPGTPKEIKYTLVKAYPFI